MDSRQASLLSIFCSDCYYFIAKFFFGEKKLEWYDCRALRENSINTDEATLGKQDLLLLTSSWQALPCIPFLSQDNFITIDPSLDYTCTLPYAKIDPEFLQMEYAVWTVKQEEDPNKWCSEIPMIKFIITVCPKSIGNIFISWVQIPAWHHICHSPPMC